MGKLLLGLLIGLVVGLGGGVVMLGAGVGAGAGTGLMTGICAVVQAAQDAGVMTADEVDQVLAAVPGTLGSALPEGTPIAGGAADCAAHMETLKAASSA
jgi:3-oxoacyl-ACP reductase-like protein